MNELVELLKKHHLTLASCESLTGGMFASDIVAVSGASNVFLGALVTYATAMKVQLAQVDQQLIDRHGVVSAHVAKAMAENTRRLMNSDIAVSFTGNAGPNQSDNKPVGLVYSCISTIDQSVIFEDLLVGSRMEIRQQVVALMKQRLLDRVNQILA